MIIDRGPLLSQDVFGSAWRWCCAGWRGSRRTGACPRFIGASTTSASRKSPSPSSSDALPRTSRRSPRRGTFPRLRTVVLWRPEQSPAARTTALHRRRTVTAEASDMLTDLVCARCAPSRSIRSRRGAGDDRAGRPPAARKRLTPPSATGWRRSRFPPGGRESWSSSCGTGGCSGWPAPPRWSWGWTSLVSTPCSWPAGRAPGLRSCSRSAGAGRAGQQALAALIAGDDHWTGTW
ncbi:hypothetical protein QJS66_18755 [Kocuria rhizophila]|nr:hypothetical protein QJS66_18755 [Kocuria rhizophila]